MKKLLIAMSAVAMAFGLNAATVDWQFAITGGSTQNAYDGYTAYLVVASAWNEATISAETFSDSNIVLDSAKFNAGSGKGTKTYTTLKNSTTAGTRSVDITSLSEGSALDVYYVLLNTNKDPNEYYIVADTLTGRGSTGEESLGGNISIGHSTLSGGEWTAVPEPTSGLLLLLGMAGLALKRKRA